MIVQWCIKGMHFPDDNAARNIIDSREGIICNWWRSVGTISPAQCRDKLTAAALDMHVNHFSEMDPDTGRPFSENTPFISLSAGTVGRDQVARTNFVSRAQKTALRFGTNFGRNSEAYLYTCWVVLAPRPAVEIEGVAEEVRDLNSYRAYSQFQLQGEITAKVSVPDNHIQKCEKWVVRGSRKKGIFEVDWSYENSRFTSPEMLTNVRELI